MNETCRVMVEGIVRAAEAQGIEVGPAELQQIADTVMAFDKMPLKQKLAIGKKIEQKFAQDPERLVVALKALNDAGDDIAPRLAQAVARDNPFAPD